MNNGLKRGAKAKPENEKKVPISVSHYLPKEDKDKVFESGAKFLALKQDLKKRLKTGLDKIVKEFK